MIHFDFTVSGIPISAQTKSPKARDDWKARVLRSAQAQLSEVSVAVATELSAAIVFFCEGESAIDVDNIAKPVLDSLAGLAYEDDSQVSQITVRKTPLAAGLVIDSPPPSLTAALAIGGDFIYVRIGRPPDHRKIPDAA